MTPRKHAELIKAWADGAEIQRLCHGIVGCAIWVDDPHPTWASNEEYRRKPVPKADVVKPAYVYCEGSIFHAKVTFSGETGEAKKVEIVK